MLRLVLVLLCLSWTSPVWAATQSAALRSAASTLANSGLKNHRSKTIFLKVVNRHSQVADSLAQEIQVQARQALVEALPDFKLVVVEESLAGVSLNRAVQLKGEYEQQGSRVTVRFTALDGVQGSVLAQAQAVYSSAGRSRQLMAILDIEAKSLSSSQRKAYSEILKSSIAATGVFRLASSADVDRMNADAIQKVYECTRDECATIIGEQLGVDRVLSSSLIQMSQKQYLLSAKIIDIRDGRIEKQTTIKHQGSENSLDRSLRVLAAKLTGGKAGRAALGRGSSQVMVKSQPSGAEIYIDGVKLNRKTPSLIRDLPGGQHKLSVLKGEQGATQVLELEEGGLAKVALTLSNELSSEVMIFSQPFEAKVHLDGNLLGTTPLQENIKPGRHQLLLTLADHAPVSREITVEPFERNEFQFELKPGRELILKVQPANAQVTIDGSLLVPGKDESVADLDETATHRKIVGQGKRQLEVSHPGSPQPFFREFDLQRDGQVEVVRLPISTAYRKKLERTEAWENWERSWKLPLYLSATGALLSAYSYQQATQAWDQQASAESSRDQAWASAASASDPQDAYEYQQQAQAYHDEAVSQSNEADQAYQTSQTAGTVALVVGVAALWFWLDEPEGPPPVSFIPPLPGRSAQLNYSWRW